MWFGYRYKLLVWLACTLTIGTILGLSSLWPTVIWAEPAEVRYGAAEILGPAVEPCVTTETVADALVVGPTDAWEQTLTTAQPGSTILLRGGTYLASAKLWLPAGAPDQFITIKPYNCEEVTLAASWRPLSYTILAGLTLDARNAADNGYVIRVDSEYKGAYWGNITQVVIRNNIIYGGQTDAIRISDHSTNITITGNQIDGGATGHNIFVTAEKLLHWPDQILITNNKLTKSIFDVASEDMFQVRDVGYVAFTFNTCTAGNHMEQCIDIKTTTTPLLIANNFFDGEHLHLNNNTGEDGSDGCMVIHESDTFADQHLIENNYFRKCKGAAIRFAAGDEGTEISSGLVRQNLFYQRSYGEGAIAIAKANDLLFTNNTMICGHLRLGNSAQTKLPTNLVLKNNIFYKTKIDDRTIRATNPYTCAHNLLFLSTGTGFAVSSCANGLDSDPQFAAAAVANFHLLPASPALQSGENGVDLGALPMIAPTTNLTFSFYLPLVRASAPNGAEIMCSP